MSMEEEKTEVVGKFNQNPVISMAVEIVKNEIELTAKKLNISKSKYIPSLLTSSVIPNKYLP